MLKFYLRLIIPHWNTCYFLTRLNENSIMIWFVHIIKRYATTQNLELKAAKMSKLFPFYYMVWFSWVWCVLNSFGLFMCIYGYLNRDINRPNNSFWICWCINRLKNYFLSPLMHQPTLDLELVEKCLIIPTVHWLTYFFQVFYVFMFAIF